MSILKRILSAFYRRENKVAERQRNSASIERNLANAVTLIAQIRVDLLPYLAREDVEIIVRHELEKALNGRRTVRVDFVSPATREGKDDDEKT